MESILIPISLGELLDKISILEIKRKFLTKKQLKNVENEIILLKNCLATLKIEVDDNLYSELKSINLKLWEIEDEIRLKERSKEFDKDFINLARSVYKTNDMRSELKLKINILYKSNITEEKLYETY